MGDEIESIRSDGCIWKLITPETYAYYELYKLYKAGFLLEDGAVNDQPAWYISAMMYIDNAEIQAENEAYEERKNK